MSVYFEGDREQSLVSYIIKQITLLYLTNCSMSVSKYSLDLICYTSHQQCVDIAFLILDPMNLFHILSIYPFSSLFLK